MPTPELSSCLKKLNSTVAPLRNFDVLREGFYKGALKYALVRAYEFAEYASNLQEHDQTVFFSAGAMRGICEDLIVLKFLRKLKRKDRDAAISARTIYETSKAMLRQKGFFKSYRPFQPTVSFNAREPILKMKEATAALKLLGQNSGMWSGKVPGPTVEAMARQTRMLALYRFIYSITSDLVHFNPRIAFRAGWGDVPRKMHFSTKNFSRYYVDFCRVYGSFLFVLFCDKFGSALQLTAEDRLSIESLRKRLDMELRWPEAVTYEEMNVKGPNQFLRIALRVAHEDKIAKRQARRKSAGIVSAVP